MGAAPGAYSYLQNQGASERKQQLFLRGMANGNLAERDRLLSYTLGEFYAEFSLFITECDIKKKEYEAMKSKIRH